MPGSTPNLRKRSRALNARAARPAGFSADEAAAEIRQRKATWKEQMEATFLPPTAQRQRTNEQKFADVTGQMFARLDHEAFHAYLDTFVYPHDQHHVPRWLNEGWPRSSKRASSTAIRCGSTPPTRSRLAQRLRGRAWRSRPAAPAGAAPDGAGARVSRATRRHQLAAALSLCLGSGLLPGVPGEPAGHAALDEYVAAEAQQLDPIARFERLVGQPLPKFERQWREAMAAAK